MVYKVLLILIVSSNPSLPCWPKSCFTSLTMEICKWHLLVTIYYYIKTLMTLWGWKIMWLHSFSWLVLWYWKNRADHCFPSLQDSLSPSKRVCLPWHKGVSGVTDGCPRRGTLVGTAFCITMKWKAKIRRAGSLGEKKTCVTEHTIFVWNLSGFSVTLELLEGRSSTLPGTNYVLNAGPSTLLFIFTSTLKSIQMMTLRLGRLLQDLKVTWHSWMAEH